MESRKIQKVGYSTLTVSLPSEWIKRNNIKQGDIVFIFQESDGTLKIVPAQLAQKEEAEEHIINVDACSEDGMLERIIVGSYILGKDVIRLKSSRRIEKNHIEEVRRVVRKLIGLGILEETPNSILLQCSIDPAKFKIDMLIRRLSLIASTILAEALQSVIEGNEQLAQEAINREDEADAIYYLAVRLILLAQTKPEIAEKIGATDILFIPALRLILQFLELIADFAEEIARKTEGLKVFRRKLSGETLKAIESVGELTQSIFQKALDCIFTCNIKIANGVLEMHKVLSTKTNVIISELPEIPYLRAIVLCLTKIADLGASIAEIAINRALENPGKDVEEVVKTVKHVRMMPLTKK
ncbi:MAG: PhoU domain-containing protein [Candidatus Bathyarchaeia archaeon]